MTLIFGVCVCCAKETCNDLFPKSSWITKFRMLINILHAANHLVSWEDQGYCIAEAGKTKRCYREREMLLQDTPGILPLYPKRSAVSKDINLWNEEDWWKDCLCLHACLRACLVKCLACISWVAMCELVKVLWITQRMVVRCEWLYACRRIEDAERGDLYSPQGSRMFEGKKLSTADTNSGKTLEHQWSTMSTCSTCKTSQNVQNAPRRPKTSQGSLCCGSSEIIQAFSEHFQIQRKFEVLWGSLQISCIHVLHQAWHLACTLPAWKYCVLEIMRFQVQWVTEGVGCWMKLRWAEVQESEGVCPWLGHSWNAIAFSWENLRFLFEIYSIVFYI